MGRHGWAAMMALTACNGGGSAPPEYAYSGLHGTLTFQQVTDGELVCDKDIAITSTGAYTGDCQDCDFAFDVSAEVTRDDSTPLCVDDYTTYQLTWRDYDGDPPLTGRWLGFATQYYYTYHTDAVQLTYIDDNQLLAGDLSGSTYFSGSYTYQVDYDDGAPSRVVTGTFGGGSSALVNGALTLEYDRSATIGVSSGDVWPCVVPVAPVATAATEQTGDGDIPCDGSRYDYWRFEDTTGAPWTASVDTTAAATAADLQVSVFGPASAADGNTCAWVDTSGAGNACAFAPEGRDGPAPTCPAVAFAGPPVAVYWLAVRVRGDSCAVGATVATYHLAIDGADAGSLRLNADDAIKGSQVTENTIRGILTVDPR